MNYSRILLVVFCLLALATPASAECAWVVWVKPMLNAGRMEYPL